MPLKQILFSFNGRINRATYWVYTLVLTFLLIIALICVGIFFNTILDGGSSNLLAGLFCGTYLYLRMLHIPRYSCKEIS